jgi:hypothetical protein
MKGYGKSLFILHCGSNCSMSRRYPHPDKAPQISEETKEILHERQVAEAKAEFDKKESENEIPVHLPAYNRDYFWKVDWKILPTDMMFILFGIALSNGYFEHSGIIHSLSPKAVLGLYALVVIAVCWYIGYMLARYKSYYPSAIYKIVGIIFSLAGITLLGYLLALTNPLILDEGNSDKSGSTLGMMATFLLVLGPFVGFGGFMTGGEVIKAEAKGKSYAGGSDEMYYGVIFSLMLACAFLVKCCMSDFVQQSKIEIIWFVLIFLGAGIIGALGIGFLMMVKWVLNKIGLYYRLAFILESVFPCVIISALIFWNEIQNQFMGDLSAHAKLGILIITGVIPFRVILIFNPPLRGINLLIGGASFLFFLFELLQ